MGSKSVLLRTPVAASGVIIGVPRFCRSGAPEEIRTPDLQISGSAIRGLPVPVHSPPCELRADDETAVLLADVLHRAWRIHVVQEGNGRDALNELVDELVDGLGTINDCP